MLTEVKNQIRISLLSIKYSIMREMLNKTTFISQIVFMLLNNATFIIQWVILYSLKDDVGGYTLKEVLLLWGVAAGTYGVSRFFFNNAFELSTIINNGKLDTFLVQPKNTLLSCITTNVKASAFGDILYAYIMLILYGFSIKSFILLTLFMITGGIIVTTVSIILSSLSFWIGNSSGLVSTGNGFMINFATYPDGIFKGVAKVLLYTVFPVGIATYMPVDIITNFNISSFITVLGFTVFMIFLSFIIFYRGLKRYSSSNLMIARV